MYLLYTSITGNTTSFVNQLYDSLKKESIPVEKFFVDDTTLEEGITKPFVVIVPTYLEGGNGVDNGDEEILTETLGDVIDYGDNASYGIGVIGSGNKNFGYQYCLTAKKYAKEFNIEYLGGYELRGDNNDIKRFTEKIKEKYNG